MKNGGYERICRWKSRWIIHCLQHLQTITTNQPQHPAALSLGVCVCVCGTDLRSVPWGHAQIKTDAGSAETRWSLNQSAGILLEFSCCPVLPGKSAGCTLKRSPTVFLSLCIKYMKICRRLTNTSEGIHKHQEVEKSTSSFSFMIHDRIFTIFDQILCIPEKVWMFSRTSQCVW